VILKIDSFPRVSPTTETATKFQAAGPKRWPSMFAFRSGETMASMASTALGTHDDL